MSTSTSGPVHSYRREYRPSYMRPENVILSLLLPLELYWRDAKTLSKEYPSLSNKEGLIYPSFTMTMYLSEYRIEQVDAQKFKVHVADGYLGCPVCGRVISAKIENVDVDLKKPVKRFTRELAYELALASLSSKLSSKVKSHIMYTHKHMFDKLGDKNILIVRNVGGQDMIMEAKISEYRCRQDGRAVIGVLGIMEHVVKEHERTDIAKNVLEFTNALLRDTNEILGLSKEKIPILSAFRNTFTYRITSQDTGSSNPRLLAFSHLTNSVSAALVAHREGVDLYFDTTIPRPVRAIYHFPLFTAMIPTIAYKTNPQGYRRFISKASHALSRLGMGVRELNHFNALITGSMVYTPIEAKHAYQVDMKTLSSVVEKLRAKARDVAEFLAYTEYGSRV